MMMMIIVLPIRWYSKFYVITWIQSHRRNLLHKHIEMRTKSANFDPMMTKTGYKTTRYGSFISLVISRGEIWNNCFCFVWIVYNSQNFKCFARLPRQIINYHRLFASIYTYYTICCGRAANAIKWYAEDDEDKKNTARRTIFYVRVSAIKPIEI